MRPSRMLAHGRGDGNTFCHDKRDGIDGDAYGLGVTRDLRSAEERGGEGGVIAHGSMAVNGLRSDGGSIVEGSSRYY